MLNLNDQAIEHALIQPMVPAEDQRHIDEIFAGVKEQVGFVPDGLRLYSMSPPLLDSFINNIGYFNQGGTELPPTLTTMIRYQVSWNSECSFCVDMNELFLSNMGLELDAIRATRGNPDAVPFSEAEKALLKFAIQSVETPEQINQTDVDALKQLGWSERAIFDAAVQAANNRAFNYVLRTFNIEHQGALA